MSRKSRSRLCHAIYQFTGRNYTNNEQLFIHITHYGLVRFEAILLQKTDSVSYELVEQEREREREVGNGCVITNRPNRTITLRTQLGDQRLRSGWMIG